MNKYIEPKLTGFDGKRYLNIDFNDEKYKSVIAIRVGNILFIQMTVETGTESQTVIANFLRDIKIKPNEHNYASAGARFVVSTYSIGGASVAYYNPNENTLTLRTGSTTYNSAIGFNIMLPIEEGY